MSIDNYKAVFIAVTGILLVSCLELLPGQVRPDGVERGGHVLAAKIDEGEFRDVAPLNKTVVSCEEAIRAVFPADKQNVAIAIAKAESGLNPNRNNAGLNKDGSTDWGCFQINDRAHAQWFKTHDWSDPMQNTRFAMQLSVNGTRWTPWSVYNNGSYQRFM